VISRKCAVTKRCVCSDANIPLTVGLWYYTLYSMKGRSSNYFCVRNGKGTDTYLLCWAGPDPSLYPAGESSGVINQRHRLREESLQWNVLSCTMIITEKKQNNLFTKSRRTAKLEHAFKYNILHMTLYSLELPTACG